MRLTIHQPAYLPWLGLMSKIKEADMYVCLNHVQYERGYVDNRNRILRNNEQEWITIPVKVGGRFKNNPLNEAEVASYEEMGRNWKVSHWNKILQAYGGMGVNAELFEDLKSMYNMSSNKLFDYADTSMRITRKHLGIDTPVLYSDTMNLKEKKSDLILEICKKLDATEYLSGPSGKEYLDKEKFSASGIKILYHNWNVQYNLSSIHYILTYGSKATNKLLEENFTIEKI